MDSSYSPKASASASASGTPAPIARRSTPSARMGATSVSCPLPAWSLATRAGARRTTASSSTVGQTLSPTPPRSSNRRRWRRAAWLLTLAGASGPAFSPDGSQIAYRYGAGGILIAAADGTNRRQLASTPDATGIVLMSRASRRMARALRSPGYNGATRSQARHVEVWIVNTDGTDLHRLTAGLTQSSPTTPAGPPMARTCCSQASQTGRTGSRTWACGPSTPTARA